MVKHLLLTSYDIRCKIEDTQNSIKPLSTMTLLANYSYAQSILQPAKMDLNKKFFPKQNTIQTFNIDV